MKGNFIQNIFKIIDGEISENNYKPKHKFFQKRASDCYWKGTFYSYIDNTGDTSVFSELKQLYENEDQKKNSEPHKAISRLRLSPHKIAIVASDWYNIEKPKINL